MAYRKCLTIIEAHINKRTKCKITTVNQRIFGKTSEQTDNYVHNRLVYLYHITRFAFLNLHHFSISIYATILKLDFNIQDLEVRSQYCSTSK